MNLTDFYVGVIAVIWLIAVIILMVWAKDAGNLATAAVIGMVSMSGLLIGHYLGSPD